MHARIGPARPANLDHLTACHACDAIHLVDEVDAAHSAKCVRCGAMLYKVRPYGPDVSLALAVTGLILFALSNAFPLLTFALEGRTQTNTLMSGVLEFWSVGYWDLAALVFATAIFFPFLYISSVLYVLLPLRYGIKPWGVAYIFRFASSLKPWAMMEVFLLGVIVGFVKLMDMADMTVEIGLYCFCCLILVNAGIATMLDSRAVWHHAQVNS